MVKFLKSNIVAIIGTIIIVLTIVIMGNRIFTVLDQNAQQIEKNRQNIESQEEPCQPEDVRYVEKAPGCNETEPAPQSNNSRSSTSATVPQSSSSTAQSSTTVSPAPAQNGSQNPTQETPANDESIIPGIDLSPVIDSVRNRLGL